MATLADYTIAGGLAALAVGIFLFWRWWKDACFDIPVIGDIQQTLGMGITHLGGGCDTGTPNLGIGAFGTKVGTMKINGREVSAYPEAQAAIDYIRGEDYLNDPLIPQAAVYKITAKKEYVKNPNGTTQMIQPVIEVSNLGVHSMTSSVFYTMNMGAIEALNRGCKMQDSIWKCPS